MAARAEDVQAQQQIEQQAQQIESSRTALETVLNVVLLAALTEWLAHTASTPQRAVATTAARTAQTVKRQAEEALEAAVKVLAVAVWTAAAGPLRDVAIRPDDAPQTLRDTARTASDWAKAHATTARRRGRRLPDVTPEDRAWAKAAAKTLSTKAVSEAMIETSSQLPAPPSGGPGFKKVWVSTADDRVRNLHWRLHGKAVDLDKPFWDWKSKGKLAYPGDPRAPLDQTIGCRCKMVMIPSANAADSRRLMGWVPRGLAAGGAIPVLTRPEQRLLDDLIAIRQ